jgi:hypothetical protein
VKQDPLALAFFGAALAVLAGLLLYVFVFKTPEPATERSPVRAFDLLKKLIQEKSAEIAAPAVTPKPSPPAKPAPPAPAAKSAVAPKQGGTAAGYPVWPPPAGTTWTYRVSVEPPLWQDAVLAYRVARQGATLIVDTDFRHAKGHMAFRLGSFRAGDPSHANTRFPGFFFYPAYFGDKLRVGQALAWEWPWQLPGGGVRPGRVKRFEGRVVASEQYQGPVFPMASMLRIEGALSYVEDGRVQASARETLWYAGKAAQLVRIERAGRTPDEGATRIVAELVEMR